MFIFGWKTTIYIIGLLQKKLCENCHNESYWLLKKVTKWFTLFFIPIIPSDTYITSCPICDHGFVIKKSEFNKLRRIAELNIKLAKGSITPEQYYAEASNLDESQQTLDPRLLQGNTDIKKYITKTHRLTPLENKLIGLALLIPVIPLWAIGDGTTNYNGYLVFLGWVLIVLAIVFFNKKSPTASKFISKG